MGWGIKPGKILSIILGGVIILSLFFIGRAESYLIRTDPPRKADALVVLMGSIADRVLHTADLYQQGYAPAVILVEENMTGIDSLRARAVQVASTSAQCINYLQQLGIPGDSIVLLPGKAESTLDEARAIAGYLKDHPAIQTVIVVSSPTHTRRASLIFSKTFRKSGLTTTVWVSPATRYQPVYEKPWWRRKEGIQSTLYEYIKLVSYLLIEQHQRS